MMRSLHVLWLTFGTAVWLSPAMASARGSMLEAVPMDGQKVRVDGLLREWPAKLDPLSRTLQGRKGPEVSGAIGYDGRFLYVGLRVRNSTLVRTSAFGRAEDHAALQLSFPGGRSYTVLLYAGAPGKSAGAVKLQGKGKVSGARIVEAPEKGGYTLEAAIPWATFPEAKTTRVGLRAALRYADYQAPGRLRAVVATAGDGKPPRLLLEAEQGLYHALVRKKGLPVEPAHFAVGNVAGDGAREAVAIYGSFLTIVGSAYRGGKEFFFQDLEVTGASAVTRFELRDLTGDGQEEIVLQRRVGSGDRYREVLQVLRISGGDTPYPAFQHEVAIVTPDLELRNRVSIEQQGRKAAIVIAQGKAEGVEPETYAEPKPGGMAAALMPWQTVKSRRYEWDGKGFEVAGEESWRPRLASPGRQRSPPSTGGPPPPPPPRPPSPDELLDRVYALYRKDRRVGPATPRFDFVTDVAGGREAERVLVHGKDVVVFGKGFKGGMSYAYLTMGFESPEDVLDVTARDLTGDGKAEIVARGVLKAQASEQLGGEVVSRHALYVYKVTEEGIRRIFAAETGRSLGDKAIVGSIGFEPGESGISFVLYPGRALGWTRKTYPFPEDRQAYGGLEPLLLPWTEMSVRRYVFDGSSYVMR